MGKYKVELWYRGAQRIGNIRRMTKNLRWVKKRNGVYTIDFSLDALQFMEYCARIGEQPSNVLWPLLTDVRIKVRDTYVIGATVVGIPPNFNQSNATIQVTCDGFLTLPGRRFITKSYTGEYTGGIIQDALETVQAETNGDLGIVFDPGSYMGAFGDRQDTYVDKNLQDIIVNRSTYVNDPFDFEFAADRRLHLYEQIGNSRPDTIINYPAGGDGIGALSMSMEHNGTEVANRIIALGSGFGEEALRYVANDGASQLKYGIIEDVVVFNDVSVMDTLVTKGETELLKRKETLILPKVVVSGDKFKTDEYGIGDRFIVSQNKYLLYKTAGYYRTEEMSVKVDDNDSEEVTLTVDNFGI